jgi:hypothetical protein
MLTLYIKYKPTGKIGENISSRDEFFENVFVKSHKDLKFRPCKTTVVFTFKEYGVVARIFFSWVLQSAHDREVDPHIFSPDKAWFSLHDEVYIQNSQYWSAENPGLIHKLPLHDEKTDVWCAGSASRWI